MRLLGHDPLCFAAHDPLAAGCRVCDAIVAGERRGRDRAVVALMAHWGEWSEQMRLSIGVAVRGVVGDEYEESRS